jgi:hypothetical protein
VHLETILAVVPLYKFIDVSYKVPRLAIVVIPEVFHTTIANLCPAIGLPGSEETVPVLANLNNAIFS